LARSYVRLAEPEVWRNHSRGYKTSWHEVWFGLFDPKFFSRLAEEFLLPHYSALRFQWCRVLMEPKIAIAMKDEGANQDEGEQSQKDRSFELYPHSLQKRERSEATSQSYVLEYSDLGRFSISYVQISGGRRIMRHGHITPSEVQPFLLF